MAERPKLKNTDDIFGSLPKESPRAKKQGASSAFSEKDDGGRPRRSPQANPAKTEAAAMPDPDWDEVPDQPSLPSAQTLADKLMAHDDRRKKLSFEKYEIPKRQPSPQDTAEIETPRARPQPAAQAVMPVPLPPISLPPQTETIRPQTQTETPRSQPKPQPQAQAHVEIARPAPQTPAAPVTFEPVGYAAPVVTEYTFQSFEMAPNAESASSREPVRRPRRPSRYAVPPEDAAPPQPEPEPAPIPRSVPQPVPIPQPGPAPMPQPGPAPIPQPVPQPVPMPQPKPQPTAAPPARPGREDLQKAEEERNRQEFLKRIASQFETQFEEKFEQDVRQGRERPSAASVPAQDPGQAGEDFLSYVQRKEREREAPGLRAELERAPAREAPGRAALAEDESAAAEFLTKFSRDVRREETRQSEDFKETLAQKFERERQRYLRELDIAPEDDSENPLTYVQGPDPELFRAPDDQKTSHPQGKDAAPPPRRKLDFQIQPEMHMDKDGKRLPKKPASHSTGPVTYTRAGAAKPQTHTEGAATGISLSGGTPPATAKDQSRRKSGEQLIMEHSALSKNSGAPGRPAKLNFTFSTPEEDALAEKASRKKTRKPVLPENKVTRRIVLGTMVVGLFAIGLMAWPLVRYMQLPGNPFAPSSEPESGPADGQTTVQETLNVYNDMSYTTPVQAGSVVFKNADLTLKNAQVSDYVIIESIQGQGKIRLEDVAVDNAISVRNGGINTLELHNVKATRLIVNNADAEMSIVASGSTDIEVVELRTPAALTQQAAVAAAIRSMVLTPAEDGGSIHAKLSGVSLNTLETSSRETVLVFENGTRAETLTADGSLSLSGAGRVMNLSIGAKTGLGAGDFEDAATVTLLVKDVEVTNINVRSQANLNLTTTVDSVTTSSPVFIGGDGNIVSFTLNPGTGAAPRLLVDVAGLNIQNLFSNTASRINITGSAVVNNLTAGASTYALGNKVNYLRVNADGVIYENEPDHTIVAPGIRPPETRADNPNLDYELGTDPASAASGDGDFSTTCGHSRESGGYLTGDGSASNPFVVTSAAQLAHVAAHPESHFVQTEDIDIMEDSQFAGGFPMIGSAENPFTGVYDGQGYMIQNLRITSGEGSVGLFASNRGQLKNIRLVSGEINATSNDIAYAGAIVGFNSEGGAVRSCSNGANVNGGASTYTGGIAGYNFGGRVRDCFNYAKIAGIRNVGGLVGFNSGGGTLAGSYNAGAVFGEDVIGAVAGRNEEATVTNCYYLESTCDFGIGEGAGTAFEKSSPDMQDPQMAADLAAGDEDSLWVQGEDSASGYRYPVLKRPA